MDGLEMWTAGEVAPPRPFPQIIVALAYLAFFAALIVACSLQATPAQIVSGVLMALSAAAWALGAIYRRAWEASHRRNHLGILVAGDPGLEIATYSHRVSVSARLLATAQIIAVFICLPTAVLALSLFTTSCLIALLRQ
jgi:hypothetical protein